MAKPRFVIPQSDLTPGGSLKTYSLQQVYNVLMNLGMMILPSDTCYSLAAIPVERSVYSNINAILNRGEEPMSLSFYNMYSVSQHVTVDNIVANLLEHFTPGPLTLVCSARGDIKKHAITLQQNTRSTDGTIGVRIPDSLIEREVAGATPYPITSAAIRDENKEIVQDFDQALEIVSRGMEANDFKNWAAIEGSSFFDQHSTVVLIDRSTRDISVKREGAISEKKLREVMNLYSQYALNTGN